MSDGRQIPGAERPSSPDGAKPQSHALASGSLPGAVVAPSSPVIQGAGPGGEPAPRGAFPSLSGADARHSIDIPPPSSVPPVSERPPGARDPYIGTTFDGRYKIERQIGEGGMGVVYLARHKVIDKRVAVKVLRADLAKDRDILDRFVQEARSASSIGNPHIIDISDFGDLPDGSTYFVMEYLEGDPLTKFIETKLDVKRLAAIAVQMADGLAAAHAAGIVHRDLKPDNVYLVTRGTEKDFVKILDFGIAKVSNSATTKLTRAGAVFGTPHYMSPEQAAGHPVDARTDIYSLGVMMYEMASGQLPFNADNFMGILTQHMYKAPVPIRALVNTTECPPGLEAIVQKCLSKKPDQRYATMEELGEDLKRLLQGDSPLAVAELMSRSSGFSVPIDYFKTSGQSAILPATPTQKRAPWPTYVWIAGVAAAVAIVAGVFFLASGNGEAGAPTAGTVVVASTPPTTAPTTAAPTGKPERIVAVAGSPESAYAMHGGEKLALPATIHVAEGEKVTIEVKADGYVSQTIELDGSSLSRTVRLEKVATAPTAKPATTGGSRPGPGPRPPATGPKQPPPAGGGSEIRDPWR